MDKYPALMESNTIFEKNNDAFSRTVHTVKLHGAQFQ